MNGIEKITAQIAQDAQAEAEGILAQAKAQAAAARAEFDRQAEADRQAILVQSAHDAGERLERLENAVSLECRKNTLAVKQELVDAAFDRALEKLAALPEEEYLSLLTRLAVSAAVTGREEVILSPKDRTRLGEKAVSLANQALSGSMTAGLTLAEESRPMAGGLILRSGLVETNCSFEVLLRLQRDTLAAQVAKTLFE